MRLSDARDQVLEAADRLLQAGMIARTWGNISCRVDENHFIITPSGRDYKSLSPEELVIVNISDGRSWGDIRPSSEVGIHRSGYAHHPDTNFIIHTHQPEASVLSAIGIDIVRDEADLGHFSDIPCAEYGFPGSDELRRNVEAALDGERNRMALMAHHGAICLGKNCMEALRFVALLEMMSTCYIQNAFGKLIGCDIAPDDILYDRLMEHCFGLTFPKTYRPLCKSERRGDIIHYHLPNGKTQRLRMDDSALVAEQRIHREIYKARPDIAAITHCVTPSALAYSLLKQPLGTYLDDFAQINGVEMQWAPMEEEAVVEALGDNHGVLLENNGALCCGNSLYDAEALAMVLEKNARSFLISKIFPNHPIQEVPRAECEKMREFYLQSYSKRF